MITLKELPEEMRDFIRSHNLLPASGLAGETPAAVQIALTRISEVVLSAFAEAAGQPGTSIREVVWNLASREPTWYAPCSMTATTAPCAA